ncbi:MAG: YcbK family protein [Syntrophorhabdaceae bacterium]|nr:YcbK family protein [Syntrophorhabdaceae bacterium]
MSSSDLVRFFLAGDGKIAIRNEHNGREVTVSLFDADGRFSEKSLDAIDRVFGFSDGQKGEHVSLRLLLLLDYFSDRIAPGKMIHLISGYRSPAYNQKLKKSGGNVAKTSTHMDGMALDFYLEGIDGKLLWEVIRKENCCGVGHYGGKSIHLDSGKPRFWQAATSKVNTKESEFNRKLYLSTENDRYRQGEKVRFFLTSLSDFPFGVRKTATLLRDGGEKNDTTSLTIQGQDDEGCVAINDRNASRSIYATLPAELGPGRYRIRFDFCKRPFEQMPEMTLSNQIEIVGD